MPSIPRPPALDTADASAPPAAPAMGALRIGSVSDESRFVVTGSRLGYGGHAGWLAVDAVENVHGNRYREGHREDATDESYELVSGHVERVAHEQQPSEEDRHSDNKSETVHAHILTLRW